ncbi:hypothetical protein JXB28_04250 [Candidatus Woesearchaeota archaeon]|nr:hypothetical protein [Candidatus Woesearchaeota archaeon]
MKRFKLKPWDLLHSLSDGTPDSRKNLERIVARHDGDFSTIFERKKKEIERRVRSFEDRREMLSSSMEPQDLLSLLNHYSGIQEELEKLCAASYLKFSENPADKVTKKSRYDIRLFNARMNDRLLFFDSWVSKGLDDDNFERLAKNSGDYERFLREERRFRPYTLDEGIEKILNSLHMLGQVERSEYYEEITSNLRFTIQEKVKIRKKGAKRKKEVTRTRVLDEIQLSDYLCHSRKQMREQAHKELFRKYREVKDTIGGSFIVQSTELKSESDQRKYPSLFSYINHENSLDDAVFEICLDVSKENTAIFTQDYFPKIRKKLSGIRGNMSCIDLDAPANGNGNGRISFEAGMNLVLESFNAFSPNFANIILDMESKRYIHSKPQRNKWSGAYCYSTPPSILPYILVNFTGYETDCIDLAHEFGHAVQNYLGCQKNNVLTYNPSEPVAEIASLFSEFLLFDRLFDKSKDNPALQKKYLLYFIDRAYYFTSRKSFLVNFEKEAHQLIGSPRFEIDDLSNLYLKRLREHFGEGVHVPEYFKDEWLLAPNLICAPGQDFSYTFGYLIGSALHEQYKKQGEKFVPSIISIFSAGDAPIEELLKKEAGIDIRPREFWQHGYDLIKVRMEELRKLAE